MTLDTAIHVLCEMHTQDDPQGGFAVHSAVSYEFRRYALSDVLKAWETLRLHDHRRTKPEDYA